MKFSDNAIDLIKHFEGLSLTEYKDSAGYATIGYGHKILRHETFGVLTEGQALALLRGDLDKVERALETLLDETLVSQDQYDALVSFVFNVGSDNFAKSTLFIKLKSGDMQGAACEFLRWTHAGGDVLPGLVRRREAERKLFEA